MTLRDWFAGKALSLALIDIGRNEFEIAGACYKIADAMLGEREKNHEPA